MEIGVIGCGAMGAGMVKNLLKHGHDVWTVDPDKETQLRMKSLGAVAVDNLSITINRLDAVILSLPLSHLVKEAIDPLMPCMKKGAYILDMGTTDVEVTKQLAKHASTYSISYFDCPVSNGPKGAEEGTLSIMVGGDVEKFTEVLPILECLGSSTTYVGPSGSGQVVKLCCNLVVAGTVTLLVEAFTTGEKAGVDPRILAKVMQSGTAKNRVFDVFGTNLLNGTEEEVLFMLNHMKKDMDLFQSLAKDRLPERALTPVIHQIFVEAQQEGYGKWDTTAVKKIYEKSKI